SAASLAIMYSGSCHSELSLPAFEVPLPEGARRPAHMWFRVERMSRLTPDIHDLAPPIALDVDRTAVSNSSTTKANGAHVQINKPPYPRRHLARGPRSGRRRRAAGGRIHHDQHRRDLAIRVCR